MLTTARWAPQADLSTVQSPVDVAVAHPCDIETTMFMSHENGAAPVTTITGIIAGHDELGEVKFTGPSWAIARAVPAIKSLLASPSTLRLFLEERT